MCVIELVCEERMDRLYTENELGGGESQTCVLNLSEVGGIGLGLRRQHESHVLVLVCGYFFMGRTTNVKNVFCLTFSRLVYCQNVS